MKKSVVVTGISSGIGKATAVELLNQGFRVFGSVRSRKDARELQAAWADDLHILVFDVTDDEAVADAARQVKDLLGNMDHLAGLINNAGIAVSGPLEHISMSEFRKQLDVNVSGVVSVTKAFLPLLKQKSDDGNSGRIINISSVSGRRPLPFAAPYVASKHALEGLSDSLRMELMLYGIDVILIEPGPVQSDIWDKIPETENNPYIGTDYEPSLRIIHSIMLQRAADALPAEAVARKIHHVLTISKPRPRYMMTKKKWLNYTLPRILPRRWVDRMIANRLGLRKKVSPQ